MNSSIEKNRWFYKRSRSLANACYKCKKEPLSSLPSNLVYSTLFRLFDEKRSVENKVCTYTLRQVFISLLALWACSSFPFGPIQRAKKEEERIFQILRIQLRSWDHGGSSSTSSPLKENKNIDIGVSTVLGHEDNLETSFFHQINGKVWRSLSVPRPNFDEQSMSFELPRTKSPFQFPSLLKLNHPKKESENDWSGALD